MNINLQKILFDLSGNIDHIETNFHTLNNIITNNKEVYLLVGDVYEEKEKMEYILKKLCLRKHLFKSSKLNKKLYDKYQKLIVYIDINGKINHNNISYTNNPNSILSNTRPIVVHYSLLNKYYRILYDDQKSKVSDITRNNRYRYYYKSKIDNKSERQIKLEFEYLNTIKKNFKKTEVIINKEKIVKDTTNKDKSEYNIDSYLSLVSEISNIINDKKLLTHKYNKSKAFQFNLFNTRIENISYYRTIPKHSQLNIDYDQKYSNNKGIYGSYIFDTFKSIYNKISKDNSHIINLLGDSFSMSNIIILNSTYNVCKTSKNKNKSKKENNSLLRNLFIKRKHSPTIIENTMVNYDKYYYGHINNILVLDSSVANLIANTFELANKTIMTTTEYSNKYSNLHELYIAK